MATNRDDEYSFDSADMMMIGGAGLLGLVSGIAIGGFFPWRAATTPALPAGTRPAGQTQTNIAQVASAIRGIVNAIDADCLRVAVSASNAPQPIGIPRTVGVRPAGATTPANYGFAKQVPISDTDFFRSGAPIDPRPSAGQYVAWLTHNGWSCNFWSRLSLSQKIQFVFGWFVGQDRTATPRGNDQYNQTFTNSVCSAFQQACIPTLTSDEAVLLRQRLGLQTGGGGGATVPTPP